MSYIGLLCFCPPFCFISLIEAWNVRMEKDLGIHVFQWPHFTEEQLGDWRDKVTCLRSSS